MDLKMIPGHNQAGYLSTPPYKHKKMFNSLIIAYEDLIMDFWKTVSFEVLGGEGKGSIVAVIQKKKILVTEQGIREVLLFGCDDPRFQGLSYTHHLFHNPVLRGFVCCLFE
ncbi:hypothetical protein Hanom_Chr07g00641241 [Helianthus anomalus]